MTHTGKSTTISVEPTVLIEGQPAGISGLSADGNHPVLISGDPTVLIAGHPAMTLDSQAADEASSVSGRPTVLIAGRPAS